MAKEKTKTVDVKLEEDGEEKVVKITIKRPASDLMSRAQRVSAKVWTDCVRDGIMTKKELSKFMRQQGIWDKDKDSEQELITKEIVALEKKLYLGKNSQKTMKASEAKNIAIEMRQKRADLRELIAERMALEANTADALSDNARFDFLVANSTYDSDGELVYKTLDDYTSQSDSEIAFAAANTLAQMMYAIDKDFEANLPENKFLKEFNFVNDDLSLVNDKGETVDLDGNRINDLGQYVDNDGNRIDKDGNKLDEDGNYVSPLKYVDDSGKQLKKSDDKPTPKRKTRAKKKETSAES